MGREQSADQVTEGFVLADQAKEWRELRARISQPHRGDVARHHERVPLAAATNRRPRRVVKESHHGLGDVLASSVAHAGRHAFKEFRGKFNALGVGGSDGGKAGHS